jgi:hypothetical protein
VDKYLADILRVFHKHNLFQEGVELIGSWCFKFYQEYLGVKEYPLRTIGYLPGDYVGVIYPGMINVQVIQRELTQQQIVEHKQYLICSVCKMPCAGTCSGKKK